jgi:hypothetical protein
MAQPGDSTPADRVPRWESPAQRMSAARGVALALGIGLLAALGWGLLRGILDLGIGLLAISAFGGWAIGAVLRQAAMSPIVASAIAAAAWALGLVFTWVVSMAILQGSSRPLLERFEATPFLDWISPQFGVFEISALLLYVGAAAYGARNTRRAATQ